jgi:DNA-binding transcriptional LysR family regulator
MFARHHVTPRIVIEADQETMLSDLVSQGIGLTLLREDVASDGEAAGKVCIWEPGIELEHLYFAYLNNQEKSAIMQAVVPLVRQVWSLEVP